MKRLSTLVLSCALVALGGACTDCNGTPPEGDAGPQLSLSDDDVRELCVIYNVGVAHYTESILQSLTACSAEERFSEVDDATRQEIEDACVPGTYYYDIFDVAREGGRVDIDMERTRACLAKGQAAQSATTLSEFNSGEGPIGPLFEDDDCLGAIRGLVSEGGECVQHWDCVEGTACEADPPDSPTLRCLAPAQDGDRCGGSRTCDVDLFCTDNETCAPAIAAGGDCVNDPLGGRECVVGTFCDEDDTGLCQPLLAEDSACADDGQCEDGLFCEGADSLADPPVLGTCAPIPAAVADRQPCDPAADVCAQLCSTCRPESAGGPTLCLDRGAAGAYCEDDDACRNGFACDLGTNECTALPPSELPGLGEACDPNEGCDEGFCAGGSCVEGNDGDPCDPDYLECADDNICVVVGTAGTCNAPPAVGEACLEEQCAADAFCNASGQCEALRGAGDECDLENNGAECVSGTCLQSSTCATPGPSCDESREWFIQLVLLGCVLPLFGRLRRRRR